jgi:hypothetical protein
MGEWTDDEAVAGEEHGTGSREISRRALLGGALAASALIAAGLPPRALTRVTRVGGNVLVSRDGYPGHAEPCLAVDPRDPRKLLAACSLTGEPTVATYVSADGGASWRAGGSLRMPTWVEGSGNLSAAFDAAGHGFVCGLTVAGEGSKGAARGVALWRTADGGRTFGAPVTVAGAGWADRPWVAVEPSWPSTVHVVWSEGSNASMSTTSLRHARSSDGGRTFEAPRTLARDPRGLGNPMVACGPAGAVSIGYSRGVGALEHEPDAPVAVCVLGSRDGGRTFAPPLALGRGVNLIGFPGTLAGSSSLPVISIDPRGGATCAAFSVHESGAGQAAILLSASRDAGRRWSPARTVMSTDEVFYFEPQLAIDDAGRIGLMAYAMHGGLLNVVLATSEPNSLRFGPAVTLTDRPFDPAVVANSRGRWWVGDYQALAATRAGFRALWSDTRTGRLELFTAVA